MTKNDEVSTSSLVQSAGNEKLASEYEQFMKMVCTTTDVTKEHSPKKNLKSTSPHSYHEFNIESNLAEDNANIEVPLKEKFDKKDKQAQEGSIKSTECEESTLSTDCQIQVNENNIQIKHVNENDKSEDSKSIPSDWENVRIKVERLSDENTESREVKKKKKKKTIYSSDSSNSTTSSDSETEKKKRKHKRKVLSNSSSSDSDSTVSSSSSSDSSSSEEKRKRKRKKKKIGKKRKKAKRITRIKKKRRRKVSSNSNSTDSDEHIKKKKKAKKKTLEDKSINNGDISKIITKSPVIDSSSDRTKILQSVAPAKKIKEEAADEDRKRSDQVVSTKKTVSDINIHDKECLKQKKERKENKLDENFIEQWEMNSIMTMQQNDSDTSSQDRTRELEKMDGVEKGKYRKKRKHSRDNVNHDKDRSSKVTEESICEEKARSDEEVEVKRKKRKEKDIKSNAEFLANWERESECITERIHEAKYLKKLGKQKKEKWGETDFDTLNVPSLTQLDKEVYQKQLLADEWEVDSLEAISDLIMSKRKSSQGSLKKIEKEVRYDRKTDTYIAIEKESMREMKKKQERLCAIRIWEEEQEEGEREEMMLLEQKNKRKTDDWDIEEESLFCKTTEEMEVCKVNDIITIEKEWTKTDEEKDVKEDTNKLTMKPGKRVKKSRWDMGSQSEEKLEAKDIWEEEYAEWSKINQCEQEFEKTRKGDLPMEGSSKSDLIDFYHGKSQSRESLERSWALEEVTIRPMQAKKDTSIKHLIPAKTNDEQLVSIKKHQTRDQFKEISDLDVKFKEKTIELYSPSSPALSQKSQVGIFIYPIYKK